MEEQDKQFHSDLEDAIATSLHTERHEIIRRSRAMDGRRALEMAVKSLIDKFSGQSEEVRALIRIVVEDVSASIRKYL